MVGQLSRRANVPGQRFTGIDIRVDVNARLSADISQFMCID
jgi:hypothetical protein